MGNPASTAALANAKKTLDDIDKHSNVSPKQSPYAPPKPPVTAAPSTDYGHARAQRNLGDELKEKEKNVNEYAAANKQ